ncbi:MAG: CPBP family intramembrane metalloprotease [Promethearchaeota archaeon]|nr:MAG: CPBP family intramembrane metalloprotease [Candidatus Lokiarchaeota archaeon]
MNDKEAHNLNEKEKNTNSKNKKEIDELSWFFCPVCGNKIPKIQSLKYCLKCGTNLDYLKKYNRLQPKKVINPYVQQTQYPQPLTPSIFLGPKKISDEEIVDTKNFELWGTMTSIGVPLGAYFLMYFLAAGLFALIIYFSFNLEFLFDPYFIIFSSFLELIFILVPVFYVDSFLQNPTLKNRLGLLGFTFQGFNKKGIIKEILIGLGFAVIGILLVATVSFLTEILLEMVFGFEIVRNLSSTTTDVELIISSADILSLILLSVVMILIIGTSEEILFRGFMQKGLSRSLGNKWSILITAFIFSMIHLLGIFLMVSESPIVLIISFLLSFIPYFAISLMLSLIYYWRNENLIAVIITHGVYNALSIIIAYMFYYMF